MDSRINILKTDLRVSPLCLGGNVFGWSADEVTSKTILSNFFANDGNFMVIATKVAKYSKRPGLSAPNIKLAVEDSLRRLQTDYIDIYYAHEDDNKTPLYESLSAFNELVVDGKVRYIAASNYSGARLTEALVVSTTNGLASYVAIQNEYNILARERFEIDIDPVLKTAGISAIPYYGLARGFLSGKYRPDTAVDSVRSEGVKGFQNERGWKVLAILDEISKAQRVSLPAVALAWLRGQESVSVPIASARTLEQLNELMQFVSLSPEEMSLINAASA